MRAWYRQFYVASGLGYDTSTIGQDGDGLVSPLEPCAFAVLTGQYGPHVEVEIEELSDAPSTVPAGWPGVSELDVVQRDGGLQAVSWGGEGWVTSRERPPGLYRVRVCAAGREAGAATGQDSALPERVLVQRWPTSVATPPVTLLADGVSTRGGLTGLFPSAVGRSLDGLADHAGSDPGPVVAVRCTRDVQVDPDTARDAAGDLRRGLTIGDDRVRDQLDGVRLDVVPITGGARFVLAHPGTSPTRAWHLTRLCRWALERLTPVGSARDPRAVRLQVRTNPPPNEIPGVLPLAAPLGRSDSVAAVLLQVLAHRGGLLFRVTLRGRAHGVDGHLPFLPDTTPGPELRGSLPTTPSVQVLLPDGRTSLFLDRSSALQLIPQADDQPVLFEEPHGGSSARLDLDYWLTPNPRSALTFRFSWARQGLPETTVQLDAETVQRVTAEAQELWPWDVTVHDRP
ncbi:hypothetical protein GB931_02240 [Modestobacter sp. I12A-02628]|uniref:Uncharacterized protein n=1 Tax=Goekera deserti TaxID=2497753 RepID=A0A7K3WDU7_9ACTN|nr:hypothetical protein [Goekera deserti]MPQ96758.1 hypothetical protein [Goekera deserti]NDI46928.1 hypothetical protein [Goekera deserti]NEL54496.1 hypothetical protein [Goekera deserti]